MSPTPIPFVNLPTSQSPTRGPSRVVFREPVIQTLNTPVIEEVRSQPALEHQIPVIIEEQFSPEIEKQKLFVFAKDGPFRDEDVFANDVFKQPNKKENFIEDPTVIRPAVLETKTVTPPFDPRRRRITKKPRVSADSSAETEESESLLSSSQNLTDRLKQLRETIRKTKESLTSQKSLFTSRQPTQAPKRKKVRVRGRKRVRIPVGRRPTVSKENLTLRKPDDNSNTIRVVIEERPRSTGRGRGRQKIEIKPNKIPEKEKFSREKKKEIMKKPPQKAKNPDKLESELEEKYGVSVVQGLLGVLNTAVAHPDKDRILHQLKGQLEAMNVDAVRKLEFGSGSSETTEPAREEEIVETTPVPVSQADSADNQTDEDGLGSELARQLARVSSLAGRFKHNKPLLVGSERQVIHSKIPQQFELDSDSVAPTFEVELPKEVFVVMPEVSTLPPTEDKTEDAEMTATTLRNFFQTTERLQKIKMSPTTPVSVTEELLYENVLDGIPDGEPGLTENFFERVPFLPDSIK